MIKTCSKCGQDKPCTEFSKHKRYADGLFCWCRPCVREYSNARRAANPQPHREKARRWLKNNPEKANASNAAWRRANPEKVAAARRKRAYGLDQDSFDRLLETQGHACAICGASFGTDKPNVDHNHASGEVRGLLCNKCNLALGLFMDDPVNLQAAIGYLESKGSYGRQASPTASV